MKSAFECKFVKHVTAWALLFNGEEAGKVVANHSDNPNGSVCTLDLIVHLGPLKSDERQTGQAAGYGYDKFSGAFSDALGKLFKLQQLPNPTNLSAVGKNACQTYLEGLGYQVIEVI